MSIGDWITLAGFVVAIVALVLPPVFERRRFRGMTEYRLHAFLETSKLRVQELDTAGPGATVPPDRAALLRADATSVLELLAENGNRIERSLHKAGREDPARTPDRHFHLMVAGLQQNLVDPIEWDDLLYCYYAGAVATLLVGAKSLRADALQIARQSLADNWFESVVENVFPNAMQARIRRTTL
jgi:hypothetical protein